MVIASLQGATVIHTGPAWRGIDESISGAESGGTVGRGNRPSLGSQCLGSVEIGAGRLMWERRLQYHSEGRRGSRGSVLMRSLPWCFTDARGRLNGVPTLLGCQACSVFCLFCLRLHVCPLLRWNLRWPGPLRAACRGSGSSD